MHSTLPGMVAIQNVFRTNSRGKPQEGDQLYPGQTLASIFDPKEMAVRCAVGEPDGVALGPELKPSLSRRLSRHRHQRPCRVCQPRRRLGPRQSDQSLQRLGQTRQHRSPNHARSLRRRSRRTPRLPRRLEMSDAQAESASGRSWLAALRRIRALRWLYSSSGAVAGRVRLPPPVQATAISRRPGAQGRFPGHHPLPRRSQSRTLRPDLHPVVPNLRIAWMAPAGETIKAGERLDQVRFLQRHPAARAKGSGAPPGRRHRSTRPSPKSQITAEQDKSDLAQAKYAVERARLEASKQDIMSKISRRREPASTSPSPSRSSKCRRPPSHLHATSDQAKIASLTRLRDQAQVGGRGHQSPHRPDGDQSADHRHSRLTPPTTAKAGTTCGPSKSATTSTPA